MSRTHVTAMLVVSAVAIPVLTVFAQALAPSGVPTTSSQGRVGDDVPNCQAAAGGSRIRANCDPEAVPTSVLRTEQQLKISLEPPLQLNAPQCETTAATEYFQSNTVAHVDGTLKIQNCSAGAAGTFNVVVRVRDEKGEVSSLDFTGKWQRSDGADVKFAADYPIGQNVDLVSVRVRDMHCTCADAPADPSREAPAEPSPDPSKKN